MQTASSPQHSTMYQRSAFHNQEKGELCTTSYLRHRITRVLTVSSEGCYCDPTQNKLNMQCPHLCAKTCECTNSGIWWVYSVQNTQQVSRSMIK